MARTRAWTLSRRALHVRHVPPPRLLRFSKINHAGHFRQPAKQRGGGDGGEEAMGQGALFRCVRLRSRSSLQCALSGEWTWAELLPVLGRQAMSGRRRGTAGPVGNEGWLVRAWGGLHAAKRAGGSDLASRQRAIPIGKWFRRGMTDGRSGGRGRWCAVWHCLRSIEFLSELTDVSASAAS